MRDGLRDPREGEGLTQVRGRPRSGGGVSPSSPSVLHLRGERSTKAPNLRQKEEDMKKSYQIEVIIGTSYALTIEAENMDEAMTYAHSYNPNSLTGSKGVKDVEEQGIDRIVTGIAG